METLLHSSNIQIQGNRLYFKRDDLLPFSFGGNKVRIAQELFADMKEKGKDCIIGYGSTTSNFCRVLSNMACSQNIPCYIVEKKSNGSAFSFNSILVKNSGAKVIECNQSNVSFAVETAIKDAKAKGYSPYYIYGDIYGNGNESVPTRAYAKCFNEIERQGVEQGVDFDYIFCATGTGMTQAGLIAGKVQSNKAIKIIGVSIARKKDTAEDSVKKFLKAYVQNGKYDLDDKVFVVDKYMCGGYAEYDKNILDTIKKVYRLDGVILDPCYTGKAFYGMLQYLRENNIKDKKILFLHTGGTPLFFDVLSTNALGE